MDLTALQHSAFLQSLGWAIANSFWQAAILWGIYQLINASYRNASARFRSNSSAVFLFFTFTWFMVTFLVKFFTPSGGGQKTLILSETQLVQLSEYLNQPGNFINWQQLITDASAALPFLSLAYLLLLIIFCSRWVTAYRHTNFIRTNGLQKPGVEWRLFTDKSAMHIGIHKKIKIWFSKHVDVPATMGYLKPVILIPIASLNQLSVDQLEAIILHELAHIKRNDYLLNLFISIIETLLFFNPFVVLLAKVIKRERENCCDDFVIQYQYDRHSYASALVSIERYRLHQHRLAMSATSGKKQLLVRVRRIMENNQRQNGLNYGQKLIALLLITGMIISLAWLSPSDKNTIITAKQGATPVLLPVPKGEQLVQLSQKKNIAEEIQNALSKNFSSKEIADLTKLVEEQVKPIAGQLMETAIKELPAAFANEKIESITPPELYRKTAPGKNDQPFNFTSNQDLANHLTNLPAISQQALESYLLKLSSGIDIKAIQGSLEKARLEIAALDWKKIETDVQEGMQNLQKEFMRIPAELKRSTPSIQKIIRNEQNKAQVELTREIKLKKEVSKLRHLQHTASLFHSINDSTRMHILPRKRVYSNQRDFQVVCSDAAQGQSYTTVVPAIAPSEFKSVYTTPNTYTFKMDNTYEYGVPEVIEMHGSGDKKYHIEFKDGFLFINGEKIRIKDLKENSGTKLRNKKVKVCTEKDHVEIRLGS